MEIKFKLFKKDRLAEEIENQQVTYYKKNFLMNELRGFATKLSGKSGNQFSNKEYQPNWFRYPDSLMKQIVIEFIYEKGEDNKEFVEKVIKAYLSDFEKRHKTMVVYEVFHVSKPNSIQLGLNFFVAFTYKNTLFEQVQLTEALKELGFSDDEPTLEWKKRETELLMKLVDNPLHNEPKEFSEKKNLFPPFVEVEKEPYVEEEVVHLIKETSFAAPDFHAVEADEKSTVTNEHDLLDFSKFLSDSVEPNVEIQGWEELEVKNKHLEQQLEHLKKKQKNFLLENKVLQDELHTLKKEKSSEPIVAKKKTREKSKKLHKIPLVDYKNMFSTVHYIEYTWANYRKNTEELSPKEIKPKLQDAMNRVEGKKIQSFILNDVLNEISIRVKIKRNLFFGAPIAVVSHSDYQLFCKMEEQYYLMQRVMQSLPKESLKKIEETNKLKA